MAGIRMAGALITGFQCGSNSVIEAPIGDRDLRDGHIRLATAAEFGKRRGAFRLRSIVYPFVRLAARLDRLLFFVQGNSLILWARSGRG